MTEREARIAFNLIPEIGAVTLDKLMSVAGGSAIAAYEAFPADRRKDWRGREPDWRGEMDKAAKSHVTLVTMLDPDYPPLLRTIASPPLVLYVAGDPAALRRPSVALVGTRRATLYGRDVAERFAYGLAQAGWSVVSGLATGIDGCAHAGALAAKGSTVGVLGGALDEFFPPENRELGRRIVRSGGAVISEFPFGRKPDTATFPQRNRIVAGLVRGVVAVESPLKSGTLITTSLALEAGRAVMAVPGRIDSQASAGCFRLLRDGARMVTSVEDVLEELGELFPKREIDGKRDVAAAPVRPAGARPSTARAAKVPPPEAKMTLEEAAVLRNVPADGISVDALVRATGLAAARMNVILVALRLKRRIRFLAGNRVAPPKEF